MPCSSARRRANPKRPASDTWIVRIAAARGAMSAHTPRAWKILRLALPTAVVETLRHPARARRNIDARLDRHGHARLEHPPFVADLVVTDVVHVHAEPVTRAVHEEAPVRALALELCHATPQQPELHQALGD